MDSIPYHVDPDPRIVGRTAIFDAMGHLIDSTRSRHCAEYEVRLLNDGLARVYPHAPLGCRIQVL